MNRIHAQCPRGPSSGSSCPDQLVSPSSAIRVSDVCLVLLTAVPSDFDRSWCAATHVKRQGLLGPRVLVLSTGVHLHRQCLSTIHAVLHFLSQAILLCCESLASSTVASASQPATSFREHLPASLRACFLITVKSLHSDSWPRPDVSLHTRTCQA